MEITQADIEHSKTVISALVGIIFLLLSVIGFSIKYIVSGFNARTKKNEQDIEKLYERLFDQREDCDSRYQEVKDAVTKLQTAHEIHHGSAR